MKKNNMKRKSGGIMIAMLIMIFSLSIIGASYLSYSMHNTKLTARTIDYLYTRAVAQSCLDFARAEIIKVMELEKLRHEKGQLKKILREGINNIPPTDHYVIAVQHYEVLNDPTLIEYGHKNKNKMLNQQIQLTIGVSNVISGSTAAIRQVVNVRAEPFLRHALFSYGDMELAPAEGAIINGPIHSNADLKIFGEGATGLVFHDDITAAGRIRIYKPARPEDSKDELKSMHAALKTKVELPDGSFQTFTANGTVMDDNGVFSTLPEWIELSDHYFGDMVMDQAHGIEKKELPTEHTPGGAHSIIEIPYNGFDSDPIVEENKLANITLINGNQGVYIKVSSDGLSADITVNGASTITIPTFTNAPTSKHPATGKYGGLPPSSWLRVHTDFCDPRQHPESHSGDFDSKLQRMQLVEIYMDEFLDTYNPEMVYIEMEQPSDSTLKSAVRLRNGSDLEAGASKITIATHSTLYVEGNYNTTTKPILSLIVADTVVAQSVNWDDAELQTWADVDVYPAQAKRVAGETSYVSAFMGGGMSDETRDRRPHGIGIMNALQLMEDWGDRTTPVPMHITGALSMLWPAMNSNNPQLYSWIYLPPERHLTFDDRFRDETPAGISDGFVEYAHAWEDISFAEAMEENVW